MQQLRLVAVMASALSISGCAGTPQSQQVGTDEFIGSTLRQYGIGPNGRVGQPEAVVVDPGTGNLAV